VPPRIAVVGSVNLDLVARVERLPRPGETLTGAEFETVPGGKGANQAVAAARLGADVTFVGAVGDDDAGRDALASLAASGVDTAGLRVVEGRTGVALILVAEDGENQIVVAPGANAGLRAEDVRIEDADAALAQLEVPLEVVAAVAEQAPWFALNAAPAREVPRGILEQADLVIVNTHERDALGEQPGLTAITLGAAGAVLMEDGWQVARATPPPVEAVDGTAAGDAFAACLVVSLLEGRSREDALARACAAGALAASRFGAQPSLPTAAEVDAAVMV
jgi:ribokinase